MVRWILVVFTLLVLIPVAQSRMSSDRIVSLSSSPRDHMGGLVSSTRYCGEYHALWMRDNLTLLLNYTFIGKSGQIPTSFIRRQTLFNSTCDDSEESIVCLNYEEKNTVISWVNTPLYSVNAISVLFPTAENLQLFQCSQQTALNEWLPVDSLQCNSPTITELQSQVGKEASSEIQFGVYSVSASLTDESTVEITTLGETLLFKPQNYSVCQSDFISIIGLFLTLVLFIAFVVLMFFAYSNKRKTNYIGNGINVSNIRYISKPFSCSINPYSKKSGVVPEPPKEQEVVTVEVPTISVVPHGTRSSFFIR